jgi:hypothetical protein
MLSTIFGKKPEETMPKREPTAPWQTVTSGVIELPIWRKLRKDGTYRYSFGISRRYRWNDRTLYARTYEMEHFWDVVKGMEEMFRIMMVDPRMSHKENRYFIDIVNALEYILKLPSLRFELNGHERPSYDK